MEKVAMSNQRLVALKGMNWNSSRLRSDLVGFERIGGGQVTIINIASLKL
jgi:hypothetical protein